MYLRFCSFFIWLFNKISVIRRDDNNFMDNLGLYTKGQDSLHIKFSHTRMIANEFWGQNRHGHSGKWIVSWVGKLSQPAGKQNRSCLFVPSMSWHSISLYPPTVSTDFAYILIKRETRGLGGRYWDTLFLVINAWIRSTIFFLSTNVKDEVTFLAGERIEVVEKDDQVGDAWWQVCTILTIYNNCTIDRHLIRSQSSGKFGLFPVSYTAPAPPVTESAPSTSTVTEERCKVRPPASPWRTWN